MVGFATALKKLLRIFFIGGGEGEITCGNGEVIDLEEGEEYFWYSPGWLEGDQYPKNIE